LLISPENVRQKEVKEGKPRKPLDVDAIVPSLKETNEILTIVIRAKLEIEVEKKLAQMVPDRKYGPTLALIHDNNVGGFVARSTSDHTFYYFGAIPIGANITSNGAGGKDLFQFIGNLNLKDPQVWHLIHFVQICQLTSHRQKKSPFIALTTASSISGMVARNCKALFGHA
jgi:hypothetical protein